MCPRKTALDGNGTVTMLFHQALEESVVEYENVLAPV
jgi:hypothetical protein